MYIYYIYIYIYILHMIHLHSVLPFDSWAKSLLLYPKQSETAEAVAFMVAPAKRGEMTPCQHVRQMTNRSFCITTVAMPCTCNSCIASAACMHKISSLCKRRACASIQIVLGASRPSSRRLKTNNKQLLKHPLDARRGSRPSDSEL